MQTRQFQYPEFRQPGQALPQEARGGDEGGAEPSECQAEGIGRHPDPEKPFYAWDYASRAGYLGWVLGSGSSDLLRAMYGWGAARPRLNDVDRVGAEVAEGSLAQRVENLNLRVTVLETYFKAAVWLAGYGAAAVTALVGVTVFK